VDNTKFLERYFKALNDYARLQNLRGYTPDLSVCTGSFCIEKAKLYGKDKEVIMQLISDGEFDNLKTKLYITFNYATFLTAGVFTSSLSWGGLYFGNLLCTEPSYTLHLVNIKILMTLTSKK
jgi:hypothetical protein